MSIESLRHGALAILLCLLVACGDSSSPTGPGSGGGGLTNEDFSGNWSMTENVDGTACGNGTTQSTYDVEITQTGANVTITTPMGVFSGTVSGNTVTWTGNYPENGGTITIDSASLTISSDGTTVIGNVAWTWTPNGAGSSCSGTTTLDGDKVVNPGGTDVSGSWSITENVNAAACGAGTYTDTYTLSITQNGGAITVTAPAGVFSGTINGSTLQWSGSYHDAADGGTVTIISLSVTVNSSGNSFTGNSTWSFVEDGTGTTCGGTTVVSGTKILK